MALEAMPPVTVQDVLELTKKSREREKKPCECWKEETPRNPKQYVEKITTKWRGGLSVDRGGHIDYTDEVCKSPQ